MIPLSAGAPPSLSFDDELRRPLTLDELEALHGAPSDPRRQPGALSGLPWSRLALVAVSCGLAGFILPLLAAQIGVAL